MGPTVKEPDVTALIVARPGEMRDGVRALLASTPNIAHIIQADDGPAALAIIRELCPQVAVLDCNIPAGDVPTLLAGIKAACPQTRCLVLADGPEQQREAESAGADVTVLKGFPAARLAQTLARLL
jgi:two-component system response regulator DesR